MQSGPSTSLFWQHVAANAGVSVAVFAAVLFALRRVILSYAVERLSELRHAVEQTTLNTEAINHLTTSMASLTATLAQHIRTAEADRQMLIELVTSDRRREAT